MIEPEIAAENAPEFVWNHLQKDLKNLAEALGKNIDDTSVVVHMVLQQMLTTSVGLEGVLCCY